MAGLVALLMLAVTPALHAQFKASLRGTITDPSGAVIPGATVTLTDKSTNQVRTATANQSGVYTFNFLPPDHYSLTVEHSGFQKKEISDLAIIPEQANALNVALAVGQVQQTVTVSGVTSALNTDTASVSQTITSNQIQHMPSFNRDVFALAQLTPGVFGDGSQTTGGTHNLPGNQGPGGPGASSAGIFQTENGPQIQTRGGQYETNGISVDGISTSSAVWGGTTVITPSEDSVQSLKVVSNDYNAANGRFSGSQIEVTTKSGTNHVHGSFFFKASRPGLNAYQGWNGARSEQAGTPASRGLNRSTSRFNNYGGSLGGPLWKNKVFAFFNWESSPYSSSNTAQGWYETPQFDKSAARSGSIAAKYLSYPGEAPASPTLVPETCALAGMTEGVNCNTEQGGLDIGSPLTSALGTQDLTYGGNSQTSGVGNGLDGIPDVAYYTTVAPSQTSQNQYNGRVDANVTNKDHVTFSLYWVPITTTSYNGPARAANLWHHTQVNDAFSVIWLHTFSPTMINQARANAAGWRWNEVATNPQEPFGLPQDNIDGFTNNNGINYFGAPGPSDLNQWTYTYSDTLTKTLGNQNINIGGELTQLYYLNNPVYAARPQFNFHNIWDFANDAPYHESGKFDHSTGVPFSNRQDDRSNIWGFFVQDDWKVMPNLTVNLGLRWSYFGAFYAKQNNLDVLRFGTGANPLDGLHVHVGGGLYNPQKSNFGPQVGFAWQPKKLENKMVVRGGFGVNYNQNEIAITANGNGNPPNAINANFVCNYPYTNNPTCAGTGILYQTAGNIHSLFGFAPNPAAITNFDSNNLPLSGAISVTGFPWNVKTITNYHYSLGVEYQMPHHLVATLGYQGSLSRNLITQYNYNVIASAQGLALNPKVNFLDYYDNRASGNYNGLIATLTHNFAHGFQVEAQYTWSKAMDEGSGPYSEDIYPFDPSAAYGPSDYNVTNAFKLFGMWQPVFFHGNNMLEKIAGGWTVSGIWNVHGGFPWTPTYSTVGSLYYPGSGIGSLRPADNLGGYGRNNSTHNYEQKVNPNFGTDGSKYFTPPTYASTTAISFPNFVAPPTPGVRRNFMTSPGYRDLDGTLSKSFGLPNMKLLGDNAKFEIRVDAYNLLNTVNIDSGSISSSIGSVSPTGTVLSLNKRFGTAGGSLGSRTVQLQARFSF